jgi:hypothetical protein
MAIQLFFCLVILIPIAWACGGNSRRERAIEYSGTANEATPALLSGFRVRRFSSFHEADIFAGYHIPHSEVFPLKSGTILVQPTIGGDGADVLIAKAVFDVGGDQFIHLTVGPAGDWPYPRDDYAVTNRVGGQDGRLREETVSAWQFTFEWRSPGMQDVWCVVETERASLADLERFISTLN